MGFFIPFLGHTQIYAREEVIWKKEEKIISSFSPQNSLAGKFITNKLKLHRMGFYWHPENLTLN